MTTPAPAHLSRAELKDLTGTPIVARQIAWLRANRWTYQLDVHGRPKIARAHYDEKMGVAGAAQAPAPFLPDWSSFKTAPA